uniref:Transmembrane protein n=1 Tax=Steinernema glaseri TaxID=37863 RepID=A0A1I8ATH2_9BILA
MPTSGLPSTERRHRAVAVGVATSLSLANFGLVCYFALLPAHGLSLPREEGEALDVVYQDRLEYNRYVETNLRKWASSGSTFVRWTEKSALRWKMKRYGERTGEASTLVARWEYGKSRYLPSSAKHVQSFTENTLKALAVERSHEILHFVKQLLGGGFCPSGVAPGLSVIEFRALEIIRWRNDSEGLFATSNDLWNRMKRDNTPGLSASCVDEVLQGSQFDYTLMESLYRSLYYEKQQTKAAVERCLPEDKRAPLQAVAEEARLPLGLGVFLTPLTTWWIMTRIMASHRKARRRARNASLGERLLSSASS